MFIIYYIKAKIKKIYICIFIRVFLTQLFFLIKIQRAVFTRFSF